MGLGLGWEPAPEQIARTRFYALYRDPFGEEWGNRAPHWAGELLHIIAYDAFNAETLTLQPVSKAAAIVDYIDEEPDVRNVEMAEAALAFLVEQGMVLVDGGQLTVPARFWPETDIPTA
jgi:hypothetical protein